MIKKKDIGIEGDLLGYLQRRALRNKATVEATLEHVIREAMRFDNMVSEMQESGRAAAIRN